MKLVFTKGSGKFDQMRIERGGVVEVVDCPRQRIIPHDMVHFAVESVLHKRGFLGRVRAGEPAQFRMASDAESDGVERWVEVFQGDAWSGSDSLPADMLDLYRVTCAARGCPTLVLDEAVVLAVRERIDTLTAQWNDLAAGGALTLHLGAAET